MRVVLQRAIEASVSIEGQIFNHIGKGLVIFLGIAMDDSEEDIVYLTGKISQLRIFQDEQQKMNLSITDIQGEILLISQFTLYASTKKGNRPSFIQAAKPDLSKPLYEAFAERLASLLPKKVKAGIFGADMKVSLTNDGPVTIIMDSKEKV